MTPERFVLAAGRVFTARESVSEQDIEDGAVLIDAGRIVAVGRRGDVVAQADGAPILADDPNGLLTPGLIDAHTHAAWMGSRHDEYEVRLAGGDYEAIAKAGGGIVSTMRAVHAASVEEITLQLRRRLMRMASLGVTTIEVKSGYGLTEAGERKQLDAIAEARGNTELPRVVPTYLALHAIPPNRRDDRASYVNDVTTRWLPAIAAANLCTYVDAYVDRAAFTVEEARLLFEKARSLGLGIRIHAGQFADVGAAELAAEFGAASADHLEHIGPRGMEALAKAGTSAVMLPTAAFTLGQAPPPCAELAKHGVALVIASDANPGTAPTESLPLALAFAARSYGFSPRDALLGATARAAHALGLGEETGQLRTGYAADVALWSLPHLNALAQPWGVSRAELVIARGKLLHRSNENR